jgi:hypothetical protein
MKRVALLQGLRSPFGYKDTNSHQYVRVTIVPCFLINFES